ncbi:salivary peroxidase/catechol oxidase [Lepeophtheirus salmonis]|uniref:salivary peroxidase/catechol oxidase n=1 Tax=Lepeophtheirus salmonis TaxID=72036 RepID=UPI001AE19604|nr:chorion peroxidase-like [Lepeophtheirus salmonis]
MSEFMSTHSPMIAGLEKMNMKVLLGFAFLLFLKSYVAMNPEEAIKIAKSKMPPAPNIRVGSFLKPYKKITKQSFKMNMRNALIRQAIREMEKNGTSRTYTEEDMMENFEEIEACRNEEINCDIKKYRTITGECNNIQNPKWGASFRPFARVIEARYGNDESNPTTFGQHYEKPGCLKSGPLPNPRLLSERFFQDRNLPSKRVTHMLTQFGQFLDHDLTLTPEAHVDVPCCKHPHQDECNPIEVPRKDPFFSRFKQTCLELTRSEKFCNSRPRQQFNAVTSFVDASNVYGSEEELAKELRVPNSYLLRITLTKTGKSLLPLIDGEFLAGDERSSEMPGLATMHNLFLREHNRIAKLLAKNKGHRSNEEIFEEARRIVGAEMQNIVYGEFLYGILGYRMYQYNLNLKPNSFYNPFINPSTSNSFATAAFRYGHSMIEGSIQRRSINTNALISTFQLKNNFNNLHQYVSKNGRGMEEIIGGLFTQPAQSSDRFIVDDVTRLLFREKNSPFGQDLMSRNIQRSRDHGLPPYGAFRQACGLKPICNWKTRPSSISKQNWNLLKRWYKSPNDIDLFVAGISETPLDGSVLGETFTCLITRQFMALKDGDRFFFTHSGQSGSFNYDQIHNIRQRTLSQIICDNTQIKTVPISVFIHGSTKVPCSKHSTLNIALFK